MIIVALVVLFLILCPLIAIALAERAPRFDREDIDYMPDEPAISNLSLSERLALREKSGVKDE